MLNFHTDSVACFTEKCLRRKPTPSGITCKGFNYKLTDSNVLLDKENLVTKTQPFLDNRNAAIEGFETCQNKESKKIYNKRSSDFNISMRNVALRRNKTKEKKTCITSPLKYCNSNNDQNSRISDSNEEKVKLYESGASPDIIDDSDKSLNISNNKEHHNSSFVKRKSSRLLEKKTKLVSTPNSDDIIRSPSPEIETITSSHQSYQVTRLSEDKFNGATTKRISGEFLSTSYNSDSLTTTKRRGTKVILETPDSDPNTSIGRKRKSSSSLLSGGKNTSLESNSSLNKNLREMKLREATIHEAFSTNDIFSETNCEPSLELGLQPKKKLRSSNESNVLDHFKILSSIQPKSGNSVVKEKDPKQKLEGHSTFVRGKSSSSLIFANPDSKETSCKKKDSLKVTEKTKKGHDRNKSPNNKSEEKGKPTTKTMQTERITRRTSNTSPIIIRSPKVELMPPAEVIPKFDHINKWLEDTCGKSVVVLSSESSFEITAPATKPIRGRRAKVSLSPRIKKKKTKAQKTLEEEQKLFEELYGSDATKR